MCLKLIDLLLKLYLEINVLKEAIKYSGIWENWPIKWGGPLKHW